MADNLFNQGRQWSLSSLYDVWALVVSDGSGSFWSAVAGAIVGGGMSTLAALSAQRRAEQHSIKREDNRESDRIDSLAVAAFSRAVRISSDVEQFRDHVRTAKAVTEERSGTELWSNLLPIANLPSELRFSDEEIVMFIQNGYPELAMKLYDVAEYHATVRKLMEDLSVLRSRLAEIPTDTFEIDEKTGSMTTGYSKEHMGKAFPTVKALRTISIHMADIYEQGSVSSANVVKLIEKFLQTERNLALTANRVATA